MEITMSECEGKTHILAAQARKAIRANPKEDDWLALNLIDVWKCCWSSSLTVHRLTAILCAVIGFDHTDHVEEQVAKSCTKLVRIGMLRSRVHQGKRLYEVNY